MHGSNRRGDVYRGFRRSYGDPAPANTRNLINCVFYTLLTNYGELFVFRYDT